MLSVKQGIAPVGAYVLGLGLVAAATTLSFLAGDRKGVFIWLAAGGLSALIMTVPLVYLGLLRPTVSLMHEVGKFASDCLKVPVRDMASAESLSRTFQNVQREFAEARFKSKELEATVNVFNVEKQQTEAVLKSLPIPVLVTNRFDELILSNEVAGRMFGFDSVSCRGKPLQEVLQAPEIVSLVRETSARKVKVPRRTVELDVKGQNGGQVALRVSLSSIIEPSGQVLGIVTVIQDVTMDREIDKRKSEFVANVAHELKTPLSAIQAYVEMLVDGEAADEETRQSFYSIVEYETNRLRAMIENLLDLSRLEAGVVELEKNRVSLHKVLHDVLKTMQPQAEKKNITIVSDISSYLVPVEGDEQYLVRVFTNLLSNAVKYTPEGGEVKLQARRDSDLVRVEFEDTGYGISKEDQERIFDKFYRVKSAAGKAKGTGLGLAMVKKIVEMHNGEVDIESEEGEGSCFRVSFPAAA